MSYARIQPYKPTGRRGWGAKASGSGPHLHQTKQIGNPVAAYSCLPWLVKSITSGAFPTGSYRQKHSASWKRIP